MPVVASLFCTLENISICTIQFALIMRLKFKPEPGQSDGSGSGRLRLRNPDSYVSTVIRLTHNFSSKLNDQEIQ